MDLKVRKTVVLHKRISPIGINSNPTEKCDRTILNRAIEKMPVRSRTNSRPQEPKNLFANVNKSESYDTDDENRPLRPNGNIEKPTARPRANSQAQGNNSPVKTSRSYDHLKDMLKRDVIDQDLENELPMMLHLGQAK